MCWIFYCNISNMPRYLSFIMIVIFLNACATLPKDITKTPSYAVEMQGDSRIGKAVAHDAVNHPGESGYYMLPSDMDAFVARAVLIEGADRTLDLQYYIVGDDLTVIFLMEKLISAADRGVRVRLLFDDLGTGLNNSQLWLLNTHPNIEVRLFNPVKKRRKGFGHLFEVLGNLKQLDHRMHNKAFIADNAIGIVGGRNLADEYFGARQDSNFADMDIMAAGPVVNDVSKSFDLYWNSEWAIPFEFLSSRKPDAEDYKKALESVKETLRQAQKSKYALSLKRSDFMSRIVERKFTYSWAKGYVLYDLPEKISDAGQKDPDVFLETQLLPLTKETKSELLFISPYFVPGKTGVEFLGNLRDSGMKVKIITNSLASTDVVAVHSGYARYRKDLLERGIELYEMRAETGDKGKENIKKYTGSVRGSLHAKVYIFDRKAVFVGSRNLDSRSKNINTEIGILVQSPEIAGEAARIFDTSTMPQYSFRLKLSEDSRLVWSTEEGGREVEYEHEPMSSLWRRFSAKVTSIFVPESLL